MYHLLDTLSAYDLLESPDEAQWEWVQQSHDWKRRNHHTTLSHSLGLLLFFSLIRSELFLLQTQPLVCALFFEKTMMYQSYHTANQSESAILGNDIFFFSKITCSVDENYSFLKPKMILKPFSLTQTKHSKTQKMWACDKILNIADHETHNTYIKLYVHSFNVVSF